MLVAFTIHCVLKIWLASEACRHFVDHRHSGTLELLLSTPLKVSQILRGNLLALQRQFAAPVATVNAISCRSRIFSVSMPAFVRPTAIGSLTRVRAS